MKLQVIGFTPPLLPCLEGYGAVLWRDASGGDRTTEREVAVGGGGGDMPNLKANRNVCPKIPAV